jgi:ribulose-phosphate 3-epimerase
MIIPSINCPPKATGEVLEKIAIARKFAKWVHLDIADGAFTFHKSWDEPAKWPHAHAPKTEVHLMVEEPKPYIEKWSTVPGVERFIVHSEVMPPGLFHVISDYARDKRRQVMLALNPETNVEVLKLYLPHALQFQILAVHPGLSGQKFQSRVLEKILWIRAHIPNAIIEVDGGITPEAARLARAAGADILVSDRYVFDRPDAAKAYRELAAI